MGRTPWSYEEIVLACDLVASNGWKVDRRTDKRVAELPQLLRRMSPELAAGDPKFRNADGVGRKTHDIATLHPGYARKQTKGARRPRRSWRRSWMTLSGCVSTLPRSGPRRSVRRSRYSTTLLEEHGYSRGRVVDLLRISLSQLDMDADRHEDLTVISPDPDGRYYVTRFGDSPGMRPDESGVEDHRQVVFLDARALTPEP
jgi:hypothetical protein